MHMRYTRGYFRRAISLLLCLTMVLSLGVTVFAEDLDLPDLTSLPEYLSATVANGTSKEAAIAALPTTITAQAQTTGPLTEFETMSWNFDDNTKPDNINVVAGNITFSNGVMNFPETTTVKATVGTEDMTDYVVEVKLRGEGTVNADYGVMFRATNVTNKNADSHNAYYVGLGVVDTNSASPVKGIKIGYANYSWNEVKAVGFNLDATAWNWLKLVVYGNTCTVFIKTSEDGSYEKVMQFKQDRFTAGQVGLRSYNQAFSADDLTVRAVTKQDLIDAEVTGDLAVNVTSWECGDYDGSKAGEYTFTGTMAEGEYTNSKNLQLKATVIVREPAAEVNVDHSIPFSQVTVEDDFWANRQKQFICQVIPTGIDNVTRLTGGIWNFETASRYLATKEGDNYTTENAEGHSGLKYVDSDVWKLVESMAYALQLDAKGDAETIAGQEYIRSKLEEWIPLFVGSQEADGYLYTCFTLAAGEIPDTQCRFTGRRDSDPIKTDGTAYATVGTDDYNADFDDHELYCAGHFYEAAVALYRATGDKRLLDAAVKNADLVARTFGEGDGKVHGVPGHQEIELALVKLASLCTELGGEYAGKSEGYIAVAKYFLDNRGGLKANTLDGTNFSASWNSYEYSQGWANAADQTKALGHCVRAEYMYTGMADVALMEIAAGNENPYQNLQTLWEDVTYTKQYIHGGVGVQGLESFGSQYTLPNDKSYCETCAQIANAMWNQRMNLLYDKSEYADVVENDLYNSIISCVNYDGDKFFYQNRIQSDSDHERSSWFGTACCPPNLMRTVMSIGGYIYFQNADGTIGVNQYIANSAELNVKGKKVELKMTSDMPWDGNVTMHVKADGSQSFTMLFRVPSWSKGTTISINGAEVDPAANANGYIEITRAWGADDVVTLSFKMEVERVYSDAKVTTNAGLVAVRRGPIIYAAEGIDNTTDVATVDLSKDATFTVNELARLSGLTGEDHYGVEDVVTIDAETTLLRNPFQAGEEVTLRLIPYYAWDNRGKTAMRVYFNESNKNTELKYYATATCGQYCYSNGAWNLNNGKYDRTESGGDRWCNWNKSINADLDWVQYEFPAKVVLRSSTITWYDDGAGVQVPDKLTIKYLNDEGKWVEVTNMTNGSTFPGNGNKKNEGSQEYAFDEIVTTAIRLYPSRNGSNQTYGRQGIIEWDVDGEVYVDSAKLKFTDTTVKAGADATVTLSLRSDNLINGGYVFVEAANADGDKLTIKELKLCDGLTGAVNPENGGISFASKSNLAAKTVLATCTFATTADTKLGDYTLSLTSASSLSAADSTTYPCELNSAKITVTHADVKVTFDPANGEDTTTQDVEYEGTVTEPEEDPTRTGYDFEAWYKDDSEYDFTAKVTEAFTLTAHWTEATYNVSFVTDPSNATVTVEDAEGNAVTANQDGTFPLVYGKSYTAKMTRTGYADKTITLNVPCETGDDWTVNDAARTASYKAEEMLANAGDFDHDGSVTIWDVQQLLKYVINLPTDLTAKQADVNRDGAVNASDISYLMTLLVD